MAGDWIKMRTDLYRDPKVCVMAECLMDPDGELARHVNQNCQRNMTVTRNVTRNAIVGALVTVWGVSRHRGKRQGDDLIVHNITPNVLDDIADMPGFGDAMMFVGWAVKNDSGLTFPRFFEEFNSEPVPSKAAERQRRYRQKRVTSQSATRNVTRDVVSNVRIEKRREEKINTPLPPLLDFPEFKKAWDEWLTYRKEIRKPLKPRSEQKQLKQLESMGGVAAVLAIENSIANSWQGLFTPKGVTVATAKPRVFDVMNDTYNPVSASE